jgi:hypothetical protein
MNILKNHDSFEASISLNDADNLSMASSIFGARSQRDAIKRPGGFGRPVVGSDPEYYSRQAQIVFRKAVKSDPELSELYLRGRSLNYNLEQSLSSAYCRVGGRPLRLQFS